MNRGELRVFERLRMEHGLRRIMVIVLMLLAFTLSACNSAGKQKGSEEGITGEGNGSGTGTATSQGQGIQYHDDVYELKGDLLSLMDAKLWEGYVYYSDMDEETGLYGIKRFRAEDGKAEILIKGEVFQGNPFMQEEEGQEKATGAKAAGQNAAAQQDGDVQGDGGRRYLRCFDLTKDGGVLALVAGYDEENLSGIYGTVKEWMLEEVDAFGNLLRTVPLESGLFARDAFSLKLGVDGDGNILIVTKQILLLNKDGEKLAEFPLEEGSFIRGIVRAEDGRLYFAMSNLSADYQTLRVDFEKKTLEELDGMPVGMNGLGIVQKDAAGKGNAENSLLLCTGDELYHYQTAKKELTGLVNWNEYGIYGPQVFGAAMYGERILALASRDGSKVELTVLTPEENGTDQGQGAKEGPETITLGVLYKWSILDKMVSEYNRSQKKYKIVVRAYGELKQGTIDYQGPSERMMMDLLGEDAPDLLDISPYLNSYGGLETTAEDLLSKGYVENLQKYLEKSSVISKEDFEEKVLAACTFEKGLPAIPTSYRLQAFCTSKKDFGGRFAWSVADMMAYDRANPEIPLFVNATKGMVFLYCVKQNMEAFVDQEKGEAHFDCPEFREILEYVNSYPVDNGSDVVIPLYNDEGLLSLEFMDAILDVQMIPYMRYDGEGQFIGYPTMDGSSCTIMSISGDAVSLGICAKSEKKEGAWDFIEYVLSHDTTNVDGEINTYGGIPTNKAVLSEYWKKLRDSDEHARINHHMTVHYSGGAEYTTHTFTQEEVDMFYQLVDSARVYDRRMDPIYMIVVEELQPYFANQKSSDQVIDLIENRVRLYLQENR